MVRKHANGKLLFAQEQFIQSYIFLA